MNLEKYIEDNILKIELHKSTKGLEINQKRFLEISPKVLVMTDKKEMQLRELVTIHKANGVTKLREATEECNYWRAYNFSKEKCIDSIFEYYQEHSYNVGLLDLVRMLNRLKISYVLNKKFKCTTVDRITYIIPRTVEFQHAINLYTKLPLVGSVKAANTNIKWDQNDVFEIDERAITKQLVEAEGKHILKHIGNSLRKIPVQA